MRALLLALLLLTPVALAWEAPAPAWTSSTLVGSRDSAQAVAYAPDGTLVAVGIIDRGEAGRDMRAWAYAPDGSLRWDRTFDHGAADRLEGVAVDARGAIHVAGTLDRGAGDDAFVARLGDGGEVLWSITLDKGTQESVRALTLTPEGDLVVVGSSASFYGLDGFVAKVRADGTEAWARAINLATVDEAFAAAVAPNGTIVVVGRTLDGTNVNGLVRAYDADGRELWTRIVDHGAHEELRGVAFLPDGSLVTSGTRTDGGTRAHWLARDGERGWARALRVDLADEGRAVRVDAGGDIVAVGIADHAGGRDGVVRKLDWDGAELWTRRVDLGATDGLGGVATRPGAVAVAGATVREDGAMAALVAAFDAPATPVALDAALQPTLGEGPEVVSATWTLDGAPVGDTPRAEAGEHVVGYRVRNAAGVASWASVVVRGLEPALPAAEAGVAPAAVQEASGAAPSVVPYLVGLVAAAALAMGLAGWLASRRR